MTVLISRKRCLIWVLTLMMGRYILLSICIDRTSRHAKPQDATRMQPDHPNQMTALSLVKAMLDALVRT